MSPDKVASPDKELCPQTDPKALSPFEKVSPPDDSKGSSSIDEMVISSPFDSSPR